MIRTLTSIKVFCARLCKPAQAEESYFAGSPRCAAPAETYDTTTFYTIQNIGNQAVTFNLSTMETEEETEPVLLLGGDTKSRLAETLAPEGTYFMVKNTGTLPVSVRLWVE